MSNRAILFNDGDVVLRILADQLMPFGISSFVEEILRRPKIFLVSRHSVQFAEPDLNHLMAGNFMAAVWTKSLADKVRILECHVEQVLLAGGQIVSDRGFIQVAGVIQLVAPILLTNPPFFSSGGSVYRVHELSRRVEISILFLRGSDERDDTVKIAVKLLVRMNSERVRRAFDHLEDIRIVELVTSITSGDQTGGLREIVNAAGDFALFEIVRDRHGPVGLDPTRPEIIIDPDVREWNRSYWIILVSRSSHSH